MSISEGPRWLMLSYQLPAKPAYARVKVWRRLQALGAVTVKGSVYALPANGETREDFAWLAKEIVESGGEAIVCEAGLVEGLSDSVRLQNPVATFTAADRDDVFVFDPRSSPSRRRRRCGTRRPRGRCGVSLRSRPKNDGSRPVDRAAPPSSWILRRITGRIEQSHETHAFLPGESRPAHRSTRREKLQAPHLQHIECRADGESEDAPSIQIPRARQRGAVTTEYVVLVGTVGLLAMFALVAAGPVLVHSYERTRDMIAGPFP